MHGEADGAHMHAPLLTIHLVDPKCLISGLVSTYICPNRIVVLINQTMEVDPEVVRELERQGGQVQPQLAALVEPGRPYAVRYFLERDIPGNQMVYLDVSSTQTDVYVQRDLMPWSVADELAAHSTIIVPHYAS